MCYQDAIPRYLHLAKACMHAGKCSLSMPKFPTGVVWDDNVDDDWALVCSLYGIREKDVRDINDARHSLL